MYTPLFHTNATPPLSTVDDVHVVCVNHIILPRTQTGSSDIPYIILLQDRYTWHFLEKYRLNRT